MTHIGTLAKSSKRYPHPHVHCNIIYNSQYMEKTQMSINRWMDKQNVTFQYIYNTISFSLKNRQVPYICDNVGEPGIYYVK